MNQKSRHLTREALPRLDNYRNIMSIQAANRPTLDELHNATLPNKRLKFMSIKLDLCRMSPKRLAKLWKIETGRIKSYA
ncbi:hypothetical protein NQ315_016937 [Exocentrus adspersus]|uniref:Amino acid permease N-terminal domain-containing protein n=1 Tax=Exocentrus adspersus TaxID=1586481 RepID=A0AAV8VZJ4_9CUCU|nr:hypothetical protein NQ315_016937 [Exocentrus adspersus]